MVRDGMDATMSGYRPLAAVVLAAGEGTRMRSETPKVLHPLCGRPMLLHVVDALVALPLERIVIVVGHGAERVTKTLQEQIASEMPIEFVEQRVQRGTGDAVSVALTAFSDEPDLDGDVLVMPGDAPLVRPEVLARLARDHREADAAATLLTAELDELTVGLRPGRPRRQGPGRPHRREDRRHPEELEIDGGQHLDLLLPAGSAGAGAAAAEPRERAGRVLPDRRGLGAAPGRPRRPRGPGRRPHRGDARQRPGPARRGREPSCAPASTCGGCAKASRWWTRPRPTSTRPSSSSPTCGCSRARSSKAAP